MITYNNRTWLGSLFHLEGTVIPHIYMPVAFIMAWSALVYSAQCRFPEILSGWHMKTPFVLLGKFVSFFLIFRTNGAYRRYWNSNSVLKDVQVASRELHQQYIVYVKGGREAENEKDRVEWEALAMRCKTDATRYLLAFCAAFKLHSRMAFDGYMRGRIDAGMIEQIMIDRARLRGLLTSEEFEIVDSLLRIEHSPVSSMSGGTNYPVSTEVSGRACHIILYFLFCLGRDTAIYAKEWGWLERCLNLADVHCALLMRAFEAMDQNICTPLPLPYGHLCKTLMFTFLLAFPFCLNNLSNGLICNVLTPVIIAIAMFGMESISMEIEDPFGDDPNDFAVMRIITAIESSMYETMLCRNEPACDNFVWVQAPEDYRQCAQFVALASEQGAVYAMAPGCSPAQYRPVAFPDRVSASPLNVHLSSFVNAKTSKSTGASGARLWQYDKWSWKVEPA